MDLLDFIQTQDYIQYNKKNGEVILYYKNSKNSYALNSIESMIWNKIAQGDTREEICESLLTQADMSNELVVDKIFRIKSKNQEVEKRRCNICIYVVEKLFVKKYILNILNFIITYLAIPIFLLGIILEYNNIDRFFLSKNIFELNQIPSVLICAIISFGISLILHEFGHAIAAISRGAFVPELGVRIQRGIVVAYTKILGIDQIANCNKRNFVHLAGISVNLLIAGILLIIDSIINNASVITRVTILVNIIISLLNISLFLDSDGSVVLMNIMGSEKPQNIKVLKSFNVKKLIVMGSVILFNFILPMFIMMMTLMK